jgi:hypothetical protein
MFYMKTHQLATRYTHATSSSKNVTHRSYNRLYAKPHMIKNAFEQNKSPRLLVCEVLTLPPDKT